MNQSCDRSDSSASRKLGVNADMRLATVAIDGTTAAAVITDGGASIVARAGGGRYLDIGEMLSDGQEGIDAASRSASEEPDLTVDECHFVRPILSPGAVFCVGLNYASHIREMGRELPEAPTLFSKLPRSLTDPGAVIHVPAISESIDYEGELCIVIGRSGRNISREAALDHVAGVTVINDVTLRDLQKRTLQWFAGKTLESATPVGPIIVTLDEVGEIGSLELVVLVNGEERQRAELSDLVFDAPALIADISRVVTLQPGDLIATGTPGGVGDAMDPKQYLRDGDVVEVTISKVGTLRNTFKVDS